ncbi:MAG: hypothetical protein ACREP2_07835, partial [Rhodanobacteraceae bacterium]
MNVVRRVLMTLALAAGLLPALSTPALASPPMPSHGVPIALQDSNLDLMPWPAHIALRDGRLPLTARFDVVVTGEPGQRVYDAATRLLQRLQRLTGIVFAQHVVTSDADATRA